MTLTNGNDLGPYDFGDPKSPTYSIAAELQAAEPHRKEQHVTDTPTVELDEETSLALAAARARRRLLEAPGLVAYVRTLVVPALGGAKDGMPRASSKEPPAPMHVDALDDSDSVYAQLVNWVDYWAERLEVRPPATLTAVWRNAAEVQGFRPSVTPPGAGQLVSYLTTWLLIRHDDIARHSFGRAYFDDVAGFLRTTRTKYPRAPRGDRHVLPRPCPVCDHFALGAEWNSEDVADFVLRCEHCGHEETAAKHLASEKAARHLVIALREERHIWDRPGVLAFYDEHGYWPTQEVQRCLVCGDLVEHPQRGNARHVRDDETGEPHDPEIADDQNGAAA